MTFGVDVSSTRAPSSHAVDSCAHQKAAHAVVSVEGPFLVEVRTEPSRDGGTRLTPTRDHSRSRSRLESPASLALTSSGDRYRASSRR